MDDIKILQLDCGGTVAGHEWPFSIIEVHTVRVHHSKFYFDRGENEFQKS